MPRSWDDILAFISPVISAEMNNALCYLVTEEKVKDAAFQMGALRAPSCDGFLGVFYHNFWGIIGEDVCGMMESFF